MECELIKAHRRVWGVMTPISPKPLNLQKLPLPDFQPYTNLTIDNKTTKSQIYFKVPIFKFQPNLDEKNLLNTNHLGKRKCHLTSFC